MNLKKLFLAVQTLALAGIASGQQPLTYLGANPDVPLDECQGDCDEDADCQV